MHGAISLTGNLAGFENERAPAPFDFFTVDIEHLSVSFMTVCQRQARHEQDGGTLHAG